MKKFLVLYMAPVAEMQQMMQSSNPEQMSAGMEAWQQWADKNEDAIDDMGAPLGKTKKVTASGVTDTKNDLGGYSIMEGNSADEVARRFKGHPHFQMTKSAWIEIVECMPMPGQDEMYDAEMADARD